ncbi:hypothetical protein G7046_g6828 [Stylonectria norvegica]|nr:hypothetical protein G7046_g6828 [Stylonectria norvegica]
MAPELRKRKPLPQIQKSTENATKPAKAKTPTKGKRKAAEDVSPVSLKKQKAAKKTAVIEKPAQKAAPKPKKKPVEEVKVVEEETTLQLESDSEEEGKEVQALVTQLDSEDEDITNGDTVYEAGQDVGKIPAVSKQVEKAAKDSTGSGVLYIGRIPHGFYEHEMRQYLEQFGPITKLRISRNKKTGASKHFAFVQFAEVSTAEIVAKTMDNYLLFGHILKCRTIPKEQVRDDLFKGANRRFKKVPWNKMAGSRLEKPLSESKWADKVSKEQTRRTKKQAKLQEIGYEFEAPEIKAIPAPAVIEEVVKAVEDAPAEDEVVDNAIEAATAENEDIVEKVVEVTEAIEAAVIEATAEDPEVEVEVAVKVKSISAPKTKVTKTKAAKKGRKAKA